MGNPKMQTLLNNLCKMFAILTKLPMKNYHFEKNCYFGTNLAKKGNANFVRKN